MKKEPIVLTMLISMKSIDLEAFLIGQLMYYQEAFGWVALGQVSTAILLGGLKARAAWSCCPELDRVVYDMTTGHSVKYFLYFVVFFFLYLLYCKVNSHFC